MRGLLKRGKKHKVQNDFLPKSLQLVDTPANPLASYLLLLIIMFFVAAVAWVCLSKIDVTAQAQGTVIHQQRVRKIKPLKTQQIKKLRVTEGQKVKKGEVLLEWRDEEVAVHLQKITQKINTVSQYIKEKKQLLSWLDNGASAEWQNLKKNQSTWPYYAYQAWYTEQQFLQNKKSALITQSQAQIFYLKSLQAKKHLGQQQLKSAKQLLDKAYISNNHWQTLQSNLIELDYQIKSKQLEQESFIQQIAQIDQSIGAQLAQKKSVLHEEIEQLEGQLQQLNSDFLQYRLKMNDHVVKAPITGVVKDLTVFGKMAVVAAGETVMTLVPLTNHLEVEAYLANQDIGFVQEGDEVKVKVSAFPFNRFGTLIGTVVNKGNDATLIAKNNLRYRLNIALKQNYLVDDVGNKLPLRSGMEVIAEIKTGRRSVLSYLLSPIRQQLGRAMQER